jgi:hypothetical protein
MNYEDIAFPSTRKIPGAVSLKDLVRSARCTYPFGPCNCVGPHVKARYSKQGAANLTYSNQRNEKRYRPKNP